jgi:hypothetical protein
MALVVKAGWVTSVLEEAVGMVEKAGARGEVEQVVVAWGLVKEEVVLVRAVEVWVKGVGA